MSFFFFLRITLEKQIIKLNSLYISPKKFDDELERLCDLIENFKSHFIHSIARRMAETNFDWKNKKQTNK